MGMLKGARNDLKFGDYHFSWTCIYYIVAIILYCLYCIHSYMGIFSVDSFSIKKQDNSKKGDMKSPVSILMDFFSAPLKNAQPSQLVTTIEEARRFMVDCFKAVGTPQQHAETVADNLLEADYRGHYSHGMNRLGK